MIWKVTGGENSDLVVELRDDGTLFWTEGVTDYFHDTLVGKTIFDDVAQAPLFAYEATSDEDVIAAFLNASLYLPKSIVEGEPPFLLVSDNIYPDDEPDDIPGDIKMLLLAVSDDEIIADATAVMNGEEDKGADGIASRNPGATRLRIYWTRGEGAAKIRWGVPHDYYRCLDHLTKYVGDRAHGLCAIYHHTAIGAWPGREKQFDWAKANVYIALKDLVLDNDETSSEGEAQ